MNTLLVVALLVSGSGLAHGRPQDYPSQGFPPQGNSLSVNCQAEEVSPGVVKYNCAGVDPKAITLSSEHILWLRGGDGEVQQLDVIVPNYRVEELIRAAIKGNKGGSTNVNILLKKPETVYDVQAQDGQNSPGGKPVVSLQYEDIAPPVSVHYPSEQAYNPLTGPIREP